MKSESKKPVPKPTKSLTLPIINNANEIYNTGNRNYEIDEGGPRNDLENKLWARNNIVESMEEYIRRIEEGEA